MTDPLDIINLGLFHIGNKAITQAQLDANAHPSAVAANTCFEPARDEVLGEANWSFNSVTEVLEEVEDITDPEWDYIFGYPTLSVGSVWNVFNDATTVTKDEQEFEVKYLPSLGVKAIHTNLPEAYAEYSYKAIDPSIWSDKFAMALSYKLGAMMAVALSGDSDKALKLMQIYGSVVDEAKRIGYSEKRKKPANNQHSTYQDAR